ncbi:hypothetical protein BH11ACT8_BH11ACT8_33410 [soil metagenome]
MTNLSGTTTTTMPTPRTRRRAAAAAGVAALGLSGALAGAAPASAVTQSSAASQLSAAGITWTSSGGCTTRSNSTCTSFDGIRQATIDGAITLKSASGCALQITGGTEVGHSTNGTYTHYNGYKLDVHRTTCVDSWVTGHYSYSGLRGDGYPMYTASSGNVYTNEGNHWDVVYYTCGC